MPLYVDRCIPQDERIALVTVFITCLVLSLGDLSPFLEGGVPLRKKLIMAEDSPHVTKQHYNNNINEYLERLTRTGPKRLQVLYKYL